MYAETLNIFFPSQPMHEDPAPAPASAVNLGSSKKQSSDHHHQKSMEVTANKTTVKDSKPPLVKVRINPSLNICTHRFWNNPSGFILFLFFDCSLRGIIEEEEQEQQQHQALSMKDQKHQIQG